MSFDYLDEEFDSVKKREQEIQRKDNEVFGDINESLINPIMHSRFDKNYAFISGVRLPEEKERKLQEKGFVFDSLASHPEHSKEIYGAIYKKSS